MKNILLFFLILFFINLFFLKQIFSFCQICTFTVGAGIGLSRWFKIDDLITGLWIGGFILSLAFWTKDWLKKKSINFPGLLFFNILFYFLLITLPLYYFNIISNFIDKINGFLGLNKLIFGIIFGIIGFLLGVLIHIYLKNKNKGKVYFLFQKVIIPVSILIILSLIFQFFLLK